MNFQKINSFFVQKYNKMHILNIIYLYYREANIMPMRKLISNPKHYPNARAQAAAIWADIEKQLRNDPSKKIGLLYSANNDQAMDLHAANQKNAKPTGIISGANQAELYAELAKLIEQNNKQNQVRILPIATSMHGGNNEDKNNQVGPEQINRDLTNIANHRQAGWDILGLQNRQGGYAIGGGVSQGWFNPNFIGIGPDGTQLPKGNPHAMSQGAYVESQLQIMEKEPFDRLKLTPLKKATAPQQTQSAPYQPEPPKPTKPLEEKWSNLHKQHNHEPPLALAPPTFDTPYKARTKQLNEGEVISFETVKDNLQKGVILVRTPTQNHVETFLIDKDPQKQIQAANLIAIHSVKSVMGNLATQVQIDMVDNRLAGVKHPIKHDDQAMKVQFKSQEEASAFSEKLFKEHGVQSYTFPGKSKTPQNGAIYLTRDDLDKIAHNSKIVNGVAAGELAYLVKAKDFEQSKKLEKAPMMTTPKDSEPEEKEETQMTFK
jgi:hypothetical protein